MTYAGPGEWQEWLSKQGPQSTAQLHARFEQEMGKLAPFYTHIHNGEGEILPIPPGLWSQPLLSRLGAVTDEIDYLAALAKRDPAAYATEDIVLLEQLSEAAWLCQTLRQRLLSSARLAKQNKESETIVRQAAAEAGPDYGE